MKLTTTHLIELIQAIPMNVPYTYVNSKPPIKCIL